jgi:hypothetical protein
MLFSQLCDLKKILSENSKLNLKYTFASDSNHCADVSKRTASNERIFSEKRR